MFDEDIDDGFWVVDVVVWVEFEFFEFGVFSYQVFDWIFEAGDDFSESFLIGGSFDVEDDFVINP